MTWLNLNEQAFLDYLFELAGNNVHDLSGWDLQFNLCCRSSLCLLAASKEAVNAFLRAPLYLVS